MMLQPNIHICLGIYDLQEDMDHHFCLATSTVKFGLLFTIGLVLVLVQPARVKDHLLQFGYFGGLSKKIVLSLT